jgi:hypothetical protein
MDDDILCLFLPNHKLIAEMLRYFFVFAGFNVNTRDAVSNPQRIKIRRLSLSGLVLH